MIKPAKEPNHKDNMMMQMIDSKGYVVSIESNPSITPTIRPTTNSTVKLRIDKKNFGN